MNKRKKKLLCIISFAVVVSISFACTKNVRADENFRVAKIKSFSGKVKIGKGGGEKTFDAIEGMSLVEGDSITTEKDSSALLYIDDDKEVKIGDNSIVNLSELSGYIDSDDQKTGISLWVGKIFSNIKKKLKIRSKYEIKVPTAVMGVRGTEFSVESLTDGEIRVIVLDGTVTAVRTVVNGSEKYSTFEITITKDQGVSMNQNDQSQSDITITGIKVNEASLFVLEILKDFIERNPESLDEDAKKEIYDEIDKRIAEKSAMEESSNDDSEIEKPLIKMDPVVTENMSLNNVMALADSETQNMQPPNLQPEGVQDNQFGQTTINEVAGQETLSMQEGLPKPMPEQAAPQQTMGEPKPEQALAQQVPPQPKPEQVPVQPITEEQKPEPVHGGTTHSSTSVNSAPSVQNSSAQTSYSTMVSGIIAASDVNGDALSYSLRMQAGHGTAVVNSATGAWAYTPAQQFTGTDSFVVTVSDGKGGIVTSTVTVIVMPNANTAVTAQDENLTANQDATVNGQLIVTNVNANATLAYTVTSNPAHGTVILNGNGSYTYTPEANYYGIDSFKFKVNDGTVDSNEATVSIKVMASNSLNLQNQMQNGSLYFDDTPRLFFDEGIAVPTDLNKIEINAVNNSNNRVSITEASVMDVSILKLYCPSMQSGQYTISIPSGVISNTTGTRYNGVINLPFTVDLQGLRSFLSSQIYDAQNLAYTQVGSGVGQCTDQSAISQLNVAINHAQNIINKNDATVGEINSEINTLQNAEKQVKNNIVNTLNVTTPAAVSVNPNFDAVIEVQPGIGNFSSGLSSSNITLGGSFAGLNIKSVSVGQNSSLAQIELSGILSSSGIGIITINPDGLENPVSLKDITASITVNP